MKRSRLREMTDEELVEQFAAIAVQQDEALLFDEIAKFNRLYGEMDEIEQELKLRPGDQRRKLGRLYDHPNIQVRLKAATRSFSSRS